ncbi:2-phosphosulfolactate phosphatase [Caproiciproducens sp. MSJ-32]|uniref:2-phosphosulfolactate phosphatase n=1 Tax=Caproiciproducens sp. MSJ-32 TaxID=2841527 RepID=UPI001C1034AA|nr:2-phosphosulfolactate phosphatase [Caproiciproducens sp. MSJ-32]MBU5453941.1 2-phosphosulfolactate phosphatase [Caproiciproducens sp. MSJ-32]
MNIDVIISANYINEEYLKDKIVIIIDMLRATSVITTAINNGAKEIIPILTVEEAYKKKEELKAIGIEALLGGERNAIKIEGFDFTNSPLEYTKERVNEKTIILTTTNGTRAINLSKNAKKIFIASMLNAKAVVAELKKEKEDIVFINAGTNGEFSMDDYICSGYMISLLSKECSCNLSDISKMAKLIYENNNNIIDFIKEAKHYNILKSLNLEKDLYYCVKKDIIKIVPYYNKSTNSIKK